MDIFHQRKEPQFHQQIADSLRKNLIQDSNIQRKVSDQQKEI